MTAAQSKADSWIETVVNVGAGFLISLIVQILVIAPMLHLRARSGTNVLIVAIFTVTSIARQYAFRRMFNGRSIWATIKGRFA